MKEEELINRIAKASEVIGELKLREDLEKAYSAYKGNQIRTRWTIGIAASILVCTISFSYLVSQDAETGLQKMQIDEQPIYNDSAQYPSDTTQMKLEVDTLQNQNSK